MNQIKQFFTHTGVHQTDLRLVVAVVIALVAAYVFNFVVTKVLRRVVRTIAALTDNAATDQRVARMRRLETFLSIGNAIIKFIVVLFALVLAWRSTYPTTAPFALIGASTFFIVLAGATIAPLLRDITYGFIMTAERWYNVGDHIVVDPFWELSGVVEQITLRSTKLRSLTGEVIWLHNQVIQGVRVTPRAVRTIAVDTFVSDLERGKKIINTAIKAVPSGAAMVTRKMIISEHEKVGDNLWRITAVGQTALGREWLIEDFAVQSIKEQDHLFDGTPCIIHGPIVRYVDAMAEKRFQRSARSKASSNS